MRVLVVTNMAPDAAYPGRGGFVRDQVRALRELGVDVELLEFPPGVRNYPTAVRVIRRTLKHGAFDLVHAHYGLAGWFAKLARARPLVVTFHGTDVRHPATGFLSRRLIGRIDLAAPASRALLQAEDGRPGIAPPPERTAILPCGANLDRFTPRSRAAARDRLGLDLEGRYLLFPAAPERRVKRFDRAEALARETGADLLSGGIITSASMPDWIAAANAVLVPSDNEGFGLIAAEALASDVPVLSTPVGIAPILLAGVEGCLVAPFDLETWAAAVRPHLDAADARVRGRARAEWVSAELLAARVLIAYRELIAEARAERDEDLA